MYVPDNYRRGVETSENCGLAALFEWVTKRIRNYSKYNKCFEYFSSVLSIANTIIAINQTTMIIRHANRAYYCQQLIPHNEEMFSWHISSDLVVNYRTNVFIAHSQLTSWCI